MSLEVPNDADQVLDETPVEETPVAQAPDALTEQELEALELSGIPADEVTALAKLPRAARALLARTAREEQDETESEPEQEPDIDAELGLSPEKIRELAEDNPDVLEAQRHMARQLRELRQNQQQQQIIAAQAEIARQYRAAVRSLPEDMRAPFDLDEPSKEVVALIRKAVDAQPKDKTDLKAAVHNVASVLHRRNSKPKVTPVGRPTPPASLTKRVAKDADESDRIKKEQARKIFAEAGWPVPD